MFYLSQLLGAQVLNAQGERVGKIVDILILASQVGQSEAAYPTIVLVEDEEDQERRVPLLDLRRHNGNWYQQHPIEQFALQSEDSANDDEVRLAREVLDKQIIDIEHKKAIRVNDVGLGDDWQLLGIDKSPLGLIRRLAPTWLQGAINQQGSILIPWSQLELVHSQPLDHSDDTPRVENIVPRQRTFTGHLSELHPADIAGIIHQLTAEQGARLIERLDDEMAADTMEEIDTERQAQIIGDLSLERATGILQEMGPDEVADLLARLPEEQAQQLLHLLNPEESEDVQDLLAYEENTAGGLMTTDYTVLGQSHTVQEAFTAMRADIKEKDVRIAYIYCVLDDNLEDPKPVGVVSIWDLLIAEPTQTLQELMETNIIKVDPDTDPRTVAAIMAKYNLLAVPVINLEGILEGVVTVDDALDVLLPPERRRKPTRMY
ncbi:MAG TPA: CBS domain-containing protein [Dictyobacter sp.]|jgi:CBS domain-containing protein|nr:CBS domain-containing protein [Dictyobacter sp.]